MVGSPSPPRSWRWPFRRNLTWIPTLEQAPSTGGLFWWLPALQSSTAKYTCHSDTKFSATLVPIAGRRLGSIIIIFHTQDRTICPDPNVFDCCALQPFPCYLACGWSSNLLSPQNSGRQMLGPVAENSWWSGRGAVLRRSPEFFILHPWSFPERDLHASLMLDSHQEATVKGGV